jgi:hypothetical protein
MLRSLTAVAALGVLSITTIQVARAQTPPGRPQQNDRPADRDLPPVPSFPAQPSDHLDSAGLPPSESPSSAAAEAGLASPYAISAKVVPGRSWARAFAGYDSAVQVFRMSASAEAALARRLVVRVDFDHGPSTSATDRVSLGLRFQLLNQTAHGLDLGAGLFYQPNDFRREGNIVAALMLERTFSQLTVVANTLLGSDPEGDDGELDGRLATLLRVSRLVQVGLDSRFRSVLSTDAKRVGTTVVDWELAVLPTAVLILGPFTLVGQAGFSGTHQTESAAQPSEQGSLHTGVLLMSGVGTAF